VPAKDIFIGGKGKAGKLEHIVGADQWQYYADPEAGKLASLDTAIEQAGTELVQHCGRHQDE
jgi:hypothetical protein